MKLIHSISSAGGDSVSEPGYKQTSGGRKRLNYSRKTRVPARGAPPDNHSRQLEKQGVATTRGGSEQVEAVEADTTSSAAGAERAEQVGAGDTKR